MKRMAEFEDIEKLFPVGGCIYFPHSDESHGPNSGGYCAGD